MEEPLPASHRQPSASAVPPAAAAAAWTVRDFETLVNAWLFSHGSANTRAAYQSDLHAFGLWSADRAQSVLQSTTADIDAYRHDCETAGVRSTTINRRLAAVSSFFRFAAAAGHVEENPVDSATRAEQQPGTATAPLATSECSSVWHAANALGPKTATLVALLLHDGLKMSEILQLDVDDLRGNPRELSVDVDRRGQRHAIELDDRTAAVIGEYRGDRTKGPLLLGDSPTRQPARLTRFGADYLLKRTGQEAGLAHPLTANSLRRSHVTLAYARGDDIDTIRQQVGHADRRTTRRYLPDED